MKDKAVNKGTNPEGQGNPHYFDMYSLKSRDAVRKETVFRPLVVKFADLVKHPDKTSKNDVS